MAYAVIKGAMDGLIKSAGNFLSVLIAITCYAAVTPLVDALLVNVLGASQGFSSWSSRIVAIVLIVVVLRLVVHLINGAVNKTPFGLLNRLGGAVVNLFIYLIVMSFAFNLFEFVDQFTKPISKIIASEKEEDRQESDRDSSIFYYPIKGILPAVVPGNAFPKQDEMSSVRIGHSSEAGE